MTERAKEIAGKLNLPKSFWYLRDDCHFPFGWRLYAAWKMLVDPNKMAAALVLHAEARIIQGEIDG